MIGEFRLIDRYRMATDERGTFSWHGKDFVCDDVLEWAEDRIRQLEQEVKSTNEVRLEVPAYVDREKIMLGLARSGYPVWAEEEKDRLDTKYYVCFSQRRSV